MCIGGCFKPRGMNRIDEIIIQINVRTIKTISLIRVTMASYCMNLERDDGRRDIGMALPDMKCLSHL